MGHCSVVENLPSDAKGPGFTLKMAKEKEKIVRLYDISVYPKDIILSQVW